MIFSCRYCTAPKRHPGCHGTCPEYLKERAEYDKCKERQDREKNVRDGIYEQMLRGVKKAKKKTKGGFYKC